MSIEFIDEISETKCKKIVENIYLSCDDDETTNIIKMPAIPLGIEIVEL